MTVRVVTKYALEMDGREWHIMPRDTKSMGGKIFVRVSGQGFGRLCLGTLPPSWARRSLGLRFLIKHRDESAVGCVRAVGGVANIGAVLVTPKKRRQPRSEIQCKRRRGDGTITAHLPCVSEGGAQLPAKSINMMKPITWQDSPFVELTSDIVNHVVMIVRAMGLSDDDAVVASLPWGCYARKDRYVVKYLARGENHYKSFAMGDDGLACLEAFAASRGPNGEWEGCEAVAETDVGQLDADSSDGDCVTEAHDADEASDADEAHGAAINNNADPDVD